MTIKITFSHSSLHDLEEIVDYYKEQKIPHIGKRLISQIIIDIELLYDQPEIGRIVPEFNTKYLRELIRPPFRIVYRCDQKKVSIVRIWRSERLLALP